MGRTKGTSAEKVGKIAAKILLYLAYGTATSVIGLEYLASYGIRGKKRDLWKMKAQLEQWFDETQIALSLNRLEKQGIIIRSEDDKLSINPRYLGLLDRINVINFRPKKGMWDGIWRIVIFDIPEKQRHYRDILRQKLVEAGAIRVQKSVWLTPVDLKPLIDYLRDQSGLGNHVQLIESKNITNNQFFLKHFDLEN